MEIILLEHVEKLGKMGDKVHVKSGYARNYLLPQNKALRATEANVAYFEKQRAELEARNKALFEEATKKAEELKGFSVVVIRQAAETGQLYGLVNVARTEDDAKKQEKAYSNETAEAAAPVVEAPVAEAAN